MCSSHDILNFSGKTVFTETIFVGHELYRHGTFEKCTIELFKRMIVEIVAVW